MKSLVLALVLVGCSTDTFTGPDGSTDDGGGGDATNESTGPGDGACTPVGTACPANALCNSFDDTQETLAPFVNISQNGGNATFVNDYVVTCPHALLAFAPASGGTGTLPRGGIGGSATLNVPSAVAHARLELDATFPKNPSGPATFLFMYADGDSTNAVGVVWNGSDWVLHDSVTNDDASMSPRADVWNHVVLDVTFSESGGTGGASFTYTDTNGQTQVAKLAKSTLATTIVSSVTFGAGVAPLGGTSGPMIMHMDDVVFSPP